MAEIATETRHTPAPWEVEYDDEECQHVIRMSTALTERGPHYVQHVIEYNHGYWDGDRDSAEAFAEAEANAVLIAAAPDLYAVCVAMHELYHEERDDDEAVYQMLTAALAKATAPQPQPEGAAQTTPGAGDGQWEEIETELLHEHLCPRCRVSGLIERTEVEQPRPGESTEGV